ncbi:apolipoprotein N-acyltransferase [Mycolicibacterium rutilum]|uniref:Apolipoprotein N-acyltransferase n=1 Tax=Mycolicibacterium rutilum TaxID=370526 RepID=A0A1H6KVX5_MYCRU|nr:apolipoprotein N-acyltransferase [Mycolicibacterium rutilum]
MRGSASALVAGALPALAFPAPAWWWLAWAGLVPLLLVIRSAPTAKHGAVRAWLGLAAFVGVTQYWLWPSAGPLLLVLAAALGALWAPFGWAAQRLLAGDLTFRRLLTAVIVLPSVWVLAEAVRSWDRLGGPWAVLGASQWNQPATLAPASLGGVWLVSVVVVAVNTALAGAVLVRTPGPVVLAVALTAVGPVWFWLGPAPEPGPTMRVALVQPGEPAGDALTERLVGQQVDLVVWGESSVGVDLAANAEAAARLAGLSRRVGADLLVNVDARSDDGGIYKTAVLVGPDGLLGSYAKTRLVPFGEYVPLRALLGRLTASTQAAAEDRQRGTGPVVLHTRTAAVGPLISFETLFPDLSVDLARLGAQLLVYQSSTSSYQGSWAQPQLAAMPAVHAVETGRPTVHAALTGISSAFDASGRRLAWLPADERGTIVVDVPLDARTTGYQRYGDWTLMAALVVVTAWCARSARRSWTGARRWQEPSRAGGPRWWTGRRCRRPADRP